MSEVNSVEIQKIVNGLIDTVTVSLSMSFILKTLDFKIMVKFNHKLLDILEIPIWNCIDSTVF